MNCPKCGKTMRLGYLTAGGGRILWTPEPRRFSNLPGGDDVLLQGLTLTGKNKVEAHICKSCRTIVAEYPGD